MSVVVVLVLLLFSFPVDGVGGGGVCPLVLCSLLLLSVLDPKTDCKELHGS